MDNFYNFLSIRGIKRIPRSLTNNTNRTRADNVNTVISNIRNENEVQTDDYTPLIQIFNDDELDDQYIEYIYKDDDDIDREFEYIQVGYPKITDNYIPNCLEFPLLSDFKKFDYHIEDIDPSKLITSQPASQFNDSLKLKHLGITHLYGFEDSRKYKNNLSTIISNYLIVAINSELLLFEFDMLNHLPKEKLLFRFETKPVFTTSTDRLISTFPYFPHTINYVKSGVFLGKEVLCACTDNGSLLIWYTEDISQHVNDKKEIVKIDPQFKIKLEASLWGLDFKDNVIVVSDNSQSITLLVYHELDERFYHEKSHQILHNIPDVSIVEYNKFEVSVACVSISGEIVIFNFKFKIFQGALNKEDYEYFKNESLYYTDSTMEHLENRNNIQPEELLELKSRKFKRINFDTPEIISRCVLNDDCWTVESIDKNWFLEVGSLATVFGDDTINEQEEMSKIQQESKILGFPSIWQFHECKTVSFENNNSVKLVSVDDEYRRIHKDMRLNKLKKILMISTASKIAIFNYPSLYCNSNTNKVFNLNIPCSEESRFANRMSISLIIPKLSCFISCSQQGLITIMRLCTYKGIYGMRQEYIFPNALRLALGYHGHRTIIGLSIKDRTITDARYLLYIIYNDGLVLTYELSSSGTELNI
ncbi:unnamed protein product [Candida verbasci]|uniref:Uncharacterized protein n=1 Tax=Candida verbasci TaxID=1227364 RepID=A0A9W4U2X3_9ASCO|nr:unnamed protein product [Candida verbasci]